MYQAQLTLILTPIIGAMVFLRSGGVDKQTEEPLEVTDTSKCALVLFVMAVFWTTQAIHSF